MSFQYDNPDHPTSISFSDMNTFAINSEFYCKQCKQEECDTCMERTVKTTNYQPAGYNPTNEEI